MSEMLSDRVAISNHPQITPITPIPSEPQRPKAATKSETGEFERPRS